MVSVKHAWFCAALTEKSLTGRAACSRVFTHSKAIPPACVSVMFWCGCRGVDVSVCVCRCELVCLGQGGVCVSICLYECPRVSICLYLCVYMCPWVCVHVRGCGCV